VLALLGQPAAALDARALDEASQQGQAAAVAQAWERLRAALAAAR